MKSSHYVRKSRISKFTSICTERVPFMWDAYFCMGAYKRDVVVVIKMGAYIHGVLILCGCLLSQFYGTIEVRIANHTW